MKSSTRRPWTSAQIPPLAEWVQENKAPLDLLVEAAARPRYFSPSPTFLDSRDESLYSMLLFPMQSLREAPRSLLVRAMFHLGEGRHAAAWQDLRACHRLARPIATDATLVGQLVAIAMDGVAGKCTNVLLQDDSLGESQAQKILQDLQAMQRDSQVARAMDQRDRLFFLDAVIRLAYQKMNLSELMGLIGAGSGTAVDLVTSTQVDWNSVLREGNRWYDRLVAA